MNPKFLDIKYLRVEKNPIATGKEWRIVNRNNGDVIGFYDNFYSAVGAAVDEVVAEATINTVKPPNAHK